MTDQEIEQAFKNAAKKYHDEWPYVDIQPQTARYFFFAGSEFGLAQAKEIYSESMEKVGEMIEGTPV